MDPATILTLVEFAIAQEPRVQASLQKIFAKGDPTPDDWRIERESLQAMNYAKLVPNTGLTPEQLTPDPSPAPVVSSSGDPVANQPATS